MGQETWHFLAGREGFEPPLAGPEPAGLPLADLPGQKYVSGTAIAGQGPGLHETAVWMPSQPLLRWPIDPTPNVVNITD